MSNTGNYFSKVECYEVPDSATEDMTSGTFEAKVKLSCLWENRIALMVDMLKRPARWPYWSGPVYCARCSVPQQGGPAVRNGQLVDRTGSRVEVDCTFQMVRWKINEAEEPTEENPNPKRYYRSVREEIELTGQFTERDPKKYKWAKTVDGTLLPGDPLTNDSAPGIIVPGQTLVRTLNGVEELPQDILGLSGYCNDRELTSPYSGLYYPAESLMFLGATLGNSYTEEGNRGYDITLRFAIQMNGWNNFFNTEAQEYQQLLYVPSYGSPQGGWSPYKPYPTANFKWLLYSSGWESEGD